MVIKQMYMQSAEDGSPVRLSMVTGGLLAVLVVGTIAVGVYPAPLVDVIETATAVILPV